MSGIDIVQVDWMDLTHSFSPSIFKGMCYVNTLWNCLRKHCPGCDWAEAVGRLRKGCDWAEAVRRLEKVGERLRQDRNKGQAEGRIYFMKS